MVRKIHDVSPAKTALISIPVVSFVRRSLARRANHRSPIWPVANSRTEPGKYLEPTAEHFDRPDNVKSLNPKWIFTTGVMFLPTPTVEGDAVYFPRLGGNLFAVKKDSGHLIWSHKISEYDGRRWAISRVSPPVDGTR